jgi:hypothetical protein
MEALIGLRSNIVFTQEKNDKGKRVYVKHHEFVFLTDSAEYERNVTNTDQLIRSRKVNTHRFTVRDDMMEKLIGALTEARKADPTKAK